MQQEGVGETHSRCHMVRLEIYHRPSAAYTVESAKGALTTSFNADINFGFQTEAPVCLRAAHNLSELPGPDFPAPAARVSTFRSGQGRFQVRFQKLRDTRKLGPS